MAEVGPADAWPVRCPCKGLVSNSRKRENMEGLEDMENHNGNAT
jgi:hypothetical protein